MSHVKTWAEQADWEVDTALAKHDAAVYAKAVADVARWLRSPAPCMNKLRKPYGTIGTTIEKLYDHIRGAAARDLESGAWKETKP